MHQPDRRRYGVLAMLLLCGLMAVSNSLIAPAAAQLAGWACPKCDEASICKQGTFDTPEGITNWRPKQCVTCPSGLTNCDFKVLTAIGSDFSCVNVSTSASHCGACGNSCPVGNTVCIDGVCSCRAGSISLSGSCPTTSFCDVAGTRNCTACPAGLANCARLAAETGVSGDCETDILTSSNSCGACGNDCNDGGRSGHVCTDGKCFCGTTEGKCPWNSPVCDNGVCKECNLATDDNDLCKANNVFDSSRFCNSATKTCETCPAGFADCEAESTLGVDDTGAPTDCETNITQSGILGRFNCGACGANCGTLSAAQSCCAGTCKCGAFLDNDTPTDGECAAATQCSTTEYCDLGLQKCMPMLPNEQSCNKNAVSVDGGSNSLNELKTCGSCNRTAGLAMIVNDNCQANNATNCGNTGTVCTSFMQTCTGGKCKCSTTNTNAFFSWNPYVDFDPDRDNKRSILDQVASGCDRAALAIFMNGFRDRVFRQVMGFADCMKLADSSATRFTRAEFGNETFRNQFCQGTPGNCTAIHCTELFQNATGADRSNFCAQADGYAGQLKRCAQSFRTRDATTTDITCSNELIVDELSPSRSNKINYLELYTFLGCRQPNENMTLVFSATPLPQTLDGVMDTAKFLLGDAAVARASFVIWAVMLSIGLYLNFLW